MNYFRNFLIIIQIVSLVSCLSCHSGKIFPRAQNGIIDLRNWDFEKDGPVKLNGEWAFYWEELIEPENFSEVNNKKPNFIDVPGVWNGYKIDEKKITGNGYATYHLKVLLNENKYPLGFKFMKMGTAYTFFVNGKKLTSVGKVGKTEKNSVPKIIPQVISYIPDKNQLDILIQISNFHYYKGGFRSVIQLGKEKDIKELREKAIAFEMLLFGSLFIMGIYHLSLFILRRKDKSSLYFGIFCLMIALRTLVINEQYLSHLFSEISFAFMYKIDFITIYLGCTVFMMFTHSLYSDEFSVLILRLSQLFGVFFTALVLFTQVTFSSHTLQIYHIIAIAFGIYVIYVMIMALKHKREGAFVFLIGFFILFFSSVNDILNANNLIYTSLVFPFGFFMFIFFQAYLLSLRFSKAFCSVEMLSKELIEKSIDLEEKNIQLTKIDKLKDEFISNVSHELRTPLNGIQGFAELLTMGAVETEEQKQEYLKYIYNDSQRLARIVDNVINISMLEQGSKSVVFKPIKLIKLENSLKYRWINDLEDRFLIDFSNISNEFQSDINIIELILNELIHNGFIFNNDIPKIDVSAKEDDKYIVFLVKDNGVGIPKDQLSIIFEKFYRIDSSIKYKIKGGIGLGLSIVKKAVNLLNGIVEVESQIGKGSTFIVKLPLRITD